MSDQNVAIAILAGGRASRFPGKLEARLDGEPLLLRAYRVAKATGFPVYVCAAAPFASYLDRALDCPIVIDRWPQGGPLRALQSACSAIAHEWVFALAADMPRIDAATIAQIAAAREPGDEAVIPRHGAAIEPLAGLYSRAAVLHETFTLFGQSQNAMRALIDRLQVRFLDLPPERFGNVNTAEDLAAMTGSGR